MGSRVNARVSHHFTAAAPRVYDAWLDPTSVRQWMSAALKSSGLSGEIVQIEIDPRVGGRFLFSDRRDGAIAKHWGTYLELERPQKIVFTWIVDPADEADPSKVTLTIEPEGTGCVATIVHEMDAKWIDYIARTEGGWSRMLASINTFLAAVK